MGAFWRTHAGWEVLHTSSRWKMSLSMVPLEEKYENQEEGRYHFKDFADIVNLIHPEVI